MTKLSQPDFARPDVEVIDLPGTFPYSPREKRTHKAKNPPESAAISERTPQAQPLPKVTKHKVVRGYAARFAQWKINNQEAARACNEAICTCTPSRAQLLLYARYHGEEKVPLNELPE